MPIRLLLVRAVGGHLRRFPVEAAIWVAGLAAMAWMDPTTTGASWCVFAQLGIEWCPGCGLGHAIAHLARGEWAASLQAHPLGIAVVILLMGRVGTLLRDAYLRNPVRPLRSY